MVVSGELSMTRVFPVVVALVVELALVLGLELDEQAATPAASRPAAASAMSLFRLCDLLISVVLLSGFSSVVD
jgi:pyrimidine deaminase RibD-like protein